MTTSLLQFKAYIKALYRTLFLSITSIDFYKDVRMKYKGYGIKYILTLSLLASIFYSIKVMNNIYLIEDGLIHKDNSYIENILKQLPEIKYNGSIIETLVETPYFIQDSLNRKIIAIDPDGNLSFNQRSKIPVILTKANLILVVYYNEDKNEEFSIKYSNFLGGEPLLITQNTLREYIIDAISKRNHIWIYTIPIMSVVYLLKILVKATIPILLLYFLSNLYNINITIQTSFRLVIFSSGIFLFSYSLLNLLMPSIVFLSEIIHIIAAYLLVMSMINTRS